MGTARFELYAYSAGTSVVTDPVSTHQTWRAAVLAGRAYGAELTVVIQHNDPYNAPSTWLRGGRKLARNGYGWVG